MNKIGYRLRAALGAVAAAAALTSAVAQTLSGLSPARKMPAGVTWSVPRASCGTFRCRRGYQRCSR